MRQHSHPPHPSVAGRRSVERADAGAPTLGWDGYSGRGSFGRPRTRSPVMLRWIWLVPPQIVSEREKKNDDIIGLTG